ncbi:NUDIX hydrolase [Alicyclobacillus acidocaldarius subsp. acidocaldarius DSM 446]|uniref:NUDIX hydrolase n=1 Tax=Alicyclobacillus acidocaldarius subsp. acidocaldarius (strain ATCC 27009 / DSM 446 / BCRC 14685 / JCM 5260 / KCTC 1825 / NBRC 15652 / NCIMB 11725 / NRRL B-14509 / 104-IA) TaxID=521098 RepID=C8WUR5_ALIAD|nr:NUDIX hydrolase [Alicyclobacillus acidocaldarius subsp. acidocaldarius DSM 446]
MGKDMQREEWLDIFTSEMIPCGTAPRSIVHERGLWHQTFHAWIATGRSPAGRLVVQLRGARKDTNPLRLDVSAAGHLEAGESPEEGVREIEEELGLHVPAGRLHKLGVVAHEVRLGPVWDREFHHLYVAIVPDLSLGVLRPAVDEIAGIYELSVRDFFDLAFGRRQEAVLTGYRVLPGHLQKDARTARWTDFVPRSRPYLDLLAHFFLREG